MNPENAELRKALAQLAEAAPTPQSLAELQATPLNHIGEQPRTRSLVAALCIAAVVAIGAVGWWAASGDREDTVDTALAEADTVTTTGQPASDSLPIETVPALPLLEDPPHLLPDIEVWEMSYFNDQTYQPSPQDWTLQLFRQGTALTDPTILIGVFDANNPDVGLNQGDNTETIELDGRSIEVAANGTFPLSNAASITFDDGNLVIAQSYSLTRPGFLDALRSIESPGERTEVEAVEGFTPLNLPEPWVDQITSREARYEGPDGAGAEVRVWSGTRNDIENQAIGRIVDATSIRPGVIGDTDVVIAQHTDSRFFIVGGGGTFVIEIDLELPAAAEPERVDEFLASLTLVDRATFETAAPAGSITTQTQHNVIAEMLSDIPVPTTFDVSQLDRTGDRYQVGAYVTGRVACAWIDQWIQATDAGNAEQAKEAANALATSRQWSILLEMEPNGGYSQVLWQYADAVVSEGTITAGQELTVAESYKEALGCDPDN